MATAQAICGSSYHEFQTLLSIKQPTAKAMADVTSSGKQEGSGSPELRSRFDSTSTALPREEEDGEMEEMEKVQVDPFASLEAKDPSEDPSEEDPDLVLELELDLEEEGTLEEEGEDEMRSDLQWWDWRAVYAADFRFLKASSFLPPLEWLPSYFRFLRGKDVTNESDVVGELSWSAKGDCIAGLTVGLMLVPQSLAFARLSGLPMRTGFYSSVLPLLVYAMFGTMRQLQIGPTAVVGMLAGQALDSAGFFTDEEHIDGAAQIALLSGGVSFRLLALWLHHGLHVPQHYAVSFHGHGHHHRHITTEGYGGRHGGAPEVLVAKHAWLGHAGAGD